MSEPDRYVDLSSYTTPNPRTSSATVVLCSNPTSAHTRLSATAPSTPSAPASTIR